MVKYLPAHEKPKPIYIYVKERKGVEPDVLVSASEQNQLFSIQFLILCMLVALIVVLFRYNNNNVEKRGEVKKQTAHICSQGLPVCKMNIKFI
jgi:hypothetical protein